MHDVDIRWMEDVKALGIDVFVDPTPPGVGQRSDIIKYVADRAGLPTMMVTGVYREPFVEDWGTTPRSTRSRTSCARSSPRV